MSRDPLDELFGPRDNKESAVNGADASAEDSAGEGERQDADSVPAEIQSSAADVNLESEGDPRPLVLPEPVLRADPPTEPDLLAGLPELPEVPEADVWGPTSVTTPAAASQQHHPADDLQTRPVPADGKRAKRAMPWIIVAVVAILLLVGAIVFVQSVTAPDSAPEQDTQAPATEDTPSAAPSDTPSEDPATTPTEDPATEKAPVVDPGDTFPMEISYAGITVDVSQQLTNVEWFAQAGPPERVLIQSGLMNSFPDSCAAMRSPEGMSPWALERGEGDNWTVVRPDGTCKAAPELYDQVWGLMQAMADSARPL